MWLLQMHDLNFYKSGNKNKDIMLQPLYKLN